MVRPAAVYSTHLATVVALPEPLPRRGHAVWELLALVAAETSSTPIAAGVMLVRRACTKAATPARAMATMPPPCSKI